MLRLIVAPGRSARTCSVAVKLSELATGVGCAASASAEPSAITIAAIKTDMLPRITIVLQIGSGAGQPRMHPLLSSLRGCARDHHLESLSRMRLARGIPAARHRNERNPHLIVNIADHLRAAA